MRNAGEDDLDGWMARLAEGDRDAFDPLFRALHPRALRLARARLGPERAGDVAQTSLVKVFARASEFEPGRPVLPWFYAVVANEVRAAARGERGHEDVAALDLAGGEDPEREILARELHVALDRAIAGLDGPSAEAISALLGRAEPPAIAPEALRKRVSRAYARLRVLLGGYR